MIALPAVECFAQCWSCKCLVHWDRGRSLVHLLFVGDGVVCCVAGSDTPKGPLWIEVRIIDTGTQQRLIILSRPTAPVLQSDIFRAVNLQRGAPEWTAVRKDSQVPIIDCNRCQFTAIRPLRCVSRQASN